MDVLQAIFPCIPAQRKTSTPKLDSAVDEKLALYTDEEHSRISIAEATESIIDTLRTAEKPGADLKSSIDSIVHQAGGWSERIATAVLNALVKVLQNVEAKMGPALKEAYERACSVAVSRDSRRHFLFCFSLMSRYGFAIYKGNPDGIFHPGIDDCPDRSLHFQCMSSKSLVTWQAKSLTTAFSI